MRPVMIRPRRVGFEDRADHPERAFLTVGSGTCFTTRSNSGASDASSGGSGWLHRHPAIAARTVEDREIELLVGRVQRGEQVEHFVDHLVGRASARSILLIATIGEGRPSAPCRRRTWSAASGLRRHRPARWRRRPSTGCARPRRRSRRGPGVSTMLMRVALPFHRGRLGENGDAAFLLDIAGVHRAFLHALVFTVDYRTA
jgi:hypothetical protein